MTTGLIRETGHCCYEEWMLERPEISMLVTREATRINTIPFARLASDRRIEFIIFGGNLALNNRNQLQEIDLCIHAHHFVFVPATFPRSLSTPQRSLRQAR